jgi:hypothetical protein
VIMKMNKLSVGHEIELLLSNSSFPSPVHGRGCSEARVRAKRFHVLRLYCSSLSRTAKSRTQMCGMARIISVFRHRTSSAFFPSKNLFNPSFPRQWESSQALKSPPSQLAVRAWSTACRKGRRGWGRHEPRQALAV